MLNPELKPCSIEEDNLRSGFGEEQTAVLSPSPDSTCSWVGVWPQKRGKKRKREEKEEKEKKGEKERKKRGKRRKKEKKGKRKWEVGLNKNNQMQKVISDKENVRKITTFNF